MKESARKVAIRCGSPVCRHTGYGTGTYVDCKYSVTEVNGKRFVVLLKGRKGKSNLIEALLLTLGLASCNGNTVYTVRLLYQMGILPHVSTDRFD